MPTKPTRRLGAYGAVGLAAVAAYAFYEPVRFRMRCVTVPLVRSGAPLRIVHISDLHMRSGDKKLAAWLHALPDALGRTPDLVLGTGDFIDDDTGIEPAVECLARLEARLGRFYVLGSHDYYQSEFRVEGYTKYFSGRRPSPPKRAATDELNAGLVAKGWTALNNDTAIVNSEHGRIRVTGVDDPYIHRDDTDHIDRSAGDVLAIGLVHAPDVVSEWMLHGFDLVVAGHTHGGQVRVPGVGALVSNCELPAALAGGLHRIGDGWLHTSRGLGTGRFSPIRFACRPEVTVLDLIPPD